MKKVLVVTESQLARYVEIGEKIEVFCEKQGTFELGEYKVIVSDTVSDRVVSMDVMSKKLKKTLA